MDRIGNTEDEAREKKRIRNRLAQRAFRRRQANHLKELKEKSDLNESPHNEAIRALQEENGHLRRQLIDVQSSMERLIATMQSLTGNVSDTLERSSPNERPKLGIENSESLSPITPSSSPETDLLQPIWTKLSNSHELDLGDLTTFDDSFITHPASEKVAMNNTLSQDQNLFHRANEQWDFGSMSSISNSGSLSQQQIPGAWSFSYQMGTEAYSIAKDQCEDLQIARCQNWPETNSPFSDHIQVLQSLLKNKINPGISLLGSGVGALHKEVLIVLSLFNSMNRPDVMGWYAKTRFYHIVHLTAWQIIPCLQTFNAIHPQYRPSPLQLQNTYPRIIDWVPFQSIRDRLIKFHAANPIIDQLVCAAVSSYVVEACLADLVKEAAPKKAYIRVTDLVQSIDGSTTSTGHKKNVSALPAPSVEALFSSPECAKEAFEMLKVDREFSKYKVDPAFFEQHPELYDHTANIVASGIPLRPSVQHRLSCPKPLTPQTFRTYCSFLDFSYGSSMGSVSCLGETC